MSMDAQRSGAGSPWTIADRLRKAREEAVEGYLSQRELAEITGISLRSVNNYESPLYQGVRKRSFVGQWALKTGWSFDWIWDGIVAAPSGPDGGSVIDESKNACTRYPLVTDLAERRKAA